LHAHTHNSFETAWMNLLRLKALFVMAVLSLANIAWAATNAVEYTYDAAGNIVRIQRQSAPGFAITGFSPTSGPVGTSVTIYGAGFSATPANNTVQFNGTAATVAASDAGSISTTVPAGATTGRISVTVGVSTVTSATDFVVVIPGAPTISGFTPGTGAAGVSVAVSGTNFDTAAGATTVKLNGVTAVAAASTDTALDFAVPGGAASGKITATTSLGTGTSAGDFIVPPAGINAADIIASLRVSPGGPNGNIAVGTSGKSGVVLFDAAVNTFYSVQFNSLQTSPAAAAIIYKVIKPDNTVLLSGSIGGTTRPTIHLPKLATAGTYSVLLSPGSATLNTNARVEVNPVLSVDGPPAAGTQDFAYQSSRFVFDAVAGQRIGIGVANLSFTPTNINSPYNGIKVFRPDGTEHTPSAVACGGPIGGNPEGNCDTELLAPATGTYTLTFETPSNAYGSFSIQINSEATGTLAPDASQGVALARVGQDARLAFNASAGDSVAIDLSAASLQPRSQTLPIKVYKPDDTALSTNSLSCASTAPPRSNFCELGTLPTSGTYSVWVNPAFGAYGSFNLTLKQGPVLQTSDPPTAFAPAGASEIARFRFAGSAGQNVSVGVANLAYVVGDQAAATYLKVYAPNQVEVGSNSCYLSWGGCRVVLANLSQTGTYSVVLQPPSAARISGNITLSSDITGTLAPSVPQTLNARNGQAARFLFAATAAESTSVKLFGLSTVPAGQSVSVNFYRPDGTALTSSNVGTPTAQIFNFASLPVTGNYEVVIIPSYGGSWQGILELDPGTAIAIDGALVSPSSVNAGESLRYTFSATAGQGIEFGLTGLAYGSPNTDSTSVKIYNPSGGSLASPSCIAGGVGCEWPMISAPATGTYSLVITPPASSTIAAGTFALSTPATGALVIGAPAQTIAVARPGQTARYTFAGTAAQLLRLNWSAPTISGASNVAVSFLKPDGTSLSSTGTIQNGVSSFVNLVSLPSTGTYTVLLNPSSAATFSAGISLAVQ